MNIVRRVTRNSLYLIASRVIGIFFTVILGVFAARKLGDAGYGRYSFIVAFITYFMVFSSSELQNVIVRDVSQKKNQDNEFLSAALIFKLFASLISVGLILFLTCAINKLSLLAPILIAALTLIPVSIYDSFEAILRAHERMEFIAIANVVYSVLKMLVGIGIISQGQNLTVLFSGFFFVEVVRAILIGIFYHFNIKSFEWIFRLACLKHLVVESYILAIKGIVGIIYYKIDIFLLSVLTNDSQVGWYAAAINIIGFIMMIVSVGSSTLVPPMAQFFMTSKEKLYKLYHLINKYIFVGLLPLTLLLMALASPIVRLAYGSQYESASLILCIGAISIISTAVLSLQGIIILISGEYKRMMRLYLVVDSFKVVLSLLLIRLYGLIGAVIAMVVVDTLAALVYQPYASRYLGDINFIKETQRPIIGIAAILLIAVFLVSVFKIPIYIMAILAFTGYLVFISRTRVITAEELSYIKSIFR